MTRREARSAGPYDLPPEPDLDELLRRLKRDWKMEIRTHIPARVISLPTPGPRVVVQVELCQVVETPDLTKLPKQMLVPPNPADGVNASAVLAPIQLVGIPLAVYGGAAGYFTVPVAPGDTGELHVHDRSIKAWLETGVAGPPLLALTHALSDSVFHPTLRPVPNALTVDPTAVVVEGQLIKIGSAATLAAARATDPVSGSVALEVWAQAVESALNGLAPGSVATLWAVGAGLPGGLGTIASGSTKTAVE